VGRKWEWCCKRSIGMVTIDWLNHRCAASCALSVATGCQNHYVVYIREWCCNWCIGSVTIDYWNHWNSGRHVAGMEPNVNCSTRILFLKLFCVDLIHKIVCMINISKIVPCRSHSKNYSMKISFLKLFCMVLISKIAHVIVRRSGILVGGGWPIDYWPYVHGTCPMSIYSF
jgi:hypothetical protein